MSLDLYDEIIGLPFNKSQDAFQKVYKKIAKSKIIEQATKQYLIDLSETKEQWCAAYRKEDAIFGVQTTGRIESLHSLMKKTIRTKCLLSELVIRLINFAQ